MIQTLAIFADQVTTVAREVGTEGKLGGQAQVAGVDGSWRAVTDTVNSMAANLTRQVRNIAEVTTAVANGDLSKKITVVVSGEIGALAETINSMGDTLATMADQVTTVAREVGTQGKLGGQAQVTGVDGTWKSLTDSVNMMAANLPLRCAPSARSRPPSPRATCRAPSTSTPRAKSDSSKTRSTR